MVLCLWLTLLRTSHISFPPSWPYKSMVTFKAPLFSALLLCISLFLSKDKVRFTSSPSAEQLTVIRSADKHVWDTTGSDTGAERQKRANCTLFNFLIIKNNLFTNSQNCGFLSLCKMLLKIFSKLQTYVNILNKTELKFT